MSSRDRLLDLLKTIQIANVGDLAAKFMYQGFSAEEVMKHLLQIKDSKRISDTDFGNDIVTLVTIGAVMGNYNEKNKMKIAEDGRAFADATIQKYEITLGGAKGNRLSVNIPRILATFPDITVRIVDKIGFERNYGNQFNCNSLPPFMKTSVFPSLIPANLEKTVRNVLLVLCNCYTAEQNMALRNLDDPVAAYNTQTKYTMLSHGSAYPTNEARLAQLKEFTFRFKDVLVVLETYSLIMNKDIGKVTAGDFTNAGLKVDTS